MHFLPSILVLLLICPWTLSFAYPVDPSKESHDGITPTEENPIIQKEQHAILPPNIKGFVAFYPRQAYGVENGSVRPAFGHGTFYQYRNPALVDAKNSPAYGYRFDGGRRFNFD